MRNRDKILAELQQIRGAEETIDPVAIVRFARNKKTELHACFEWDDSKAAHEHRLWQARQICRSYITVIDTGSGPSRPMKAFVNLVDEEGDREGYQPIQEVLSNEEKRFRLVAAQLRTLASVYHAYPLAELEPIGRAIERCQRALLTSGELAA